MNKYIDGAMCTHIHTLVSVTYPFQYRAVVWLKCTRNTQTWGLALFQMGMGEVRSVQGSETACSEWTEMAASISSRPTTKMH